MKIVFGLGQIKYSGAENVARFLMDRLTSDGHDVYTLIYTYMPADAETIEKYHIVDCIVRGSGPINVLRRIAKTRKIIKLLNPDIVLAFNCHYAFPIVPALMGIKNTKLIVCERNDPSSIPISKMRRKLRNFLYKFADAGVFQTDVIAEYFKKIVKYRYVIPNPIRQRGTICLPLAERKKVFVTVARLDDLQKNQTLMIKAFAKVSKNHNNYDLHLLGDGPDKEKYEKLIVELGVGSNVKLLGNIENPIDYIKHCRCFLLTSEFEGMPNALVEAMSIGLPCISTDCRGGGAAYIIKNGENGILIPKGDEQKLVESINTLIENDELCDKLGKQAFLINEKLDGALILEKWFTVFSNIMGVR